MKYMLISTCERDIQGPQFFSTKEEAHDAMLNEVEEVLDGRAIYDYGEVFDLTAYINDLHGNNFDWAIFVVGD